MTMDRVYNPQQQHGFQQSAEAQEAGRTQSTHHSQLHYLQQQAMQFRPTPTPPPHQHAPTTMLHQNHSNLLHPIQQQSQVQSNLYHPHHMTNHQYSQEHERHAAYHSTLMNRPGHPPPPPPSQNSQPVINHQHPAEGYSNGHIFVPPKMLTNLIQNPTPISSTNVMRNSLPTATGRPMDLDSDMIHRNSLQSSYYSNTHYQYHQPSNLRRHPTHHNKYIAEQQQLLQSNYPSNQPSIESSNAQTESKQPEIITFDTVDQASQDSYTDKVIRAILEAKHALEKPIEERDEHDILLIDSLCSLVHGFDAFPESVRRALAAQTVLIVIDEKGKELIVHNEELDSFCVIIFGECEQLNETKTKPIRYYHVGDAFGVCEPTTETIRFVGHMITRCENCAFLCVKRDDFYTILTDPANYPRILRHRDQSGSIICVSQFNIDKTFSGLQSSNHAQSNQCKTILPNGYTILKATESCMLTALVDGYERSDPEYVEDFLLLFRVFMTWDNKDKEKQLPPGMIKLCLTLAKWLESVDYRDHVVQIMLTWLSSYYHDFELNTDFSYLFFRLLESRLLHLTMNNQLHLLHATLTAKSKTRHVIISRSSREQPLAFAISGGYEKNCGIFVTHVHGTTSEESPLDTLLTYLNYQSSVHLDRNHPGPAVPPRNRSLTSNQAINHENIVNKISSQLKPGDQILEVNGTNFAAIKLIEAQKRLDMSTHLSLVVRYNPSAYHEMRALPEGKRKSSMSSISSVSPFPQQSQKFTFNLHDLPLSKTGNEQHPPASPLFSTNANFGFRSIIKSVPKNDRYRLTNLINSSKQFVKQIRDSTAQSNNSETGSKASDNISDDVQNIDSDLSKIKSNPDLLGLRKDKQTDYGLANVVCPDELSTSSVVENATNGFSNQTLVNVLRVFNAANNDSRYLLIHEETTAREVVMVAVKEFNLTSTFGPTVSAGEKIVSSLNWRLYEVSVVPESRTIKQKCLSEQTSRLAETASLCSRFYIKNNSQNSLGPTKLDMGDDALVNEILKESPANVSITSLNATLLAVELTLADFDKFRSIEPQQFVYDTFFDCSDKQIQNSNTNGSISSHDSASLKSSSSGSQDSSDVLHQLNKTRSIPSSWMKEFRQFADISNREMFWVICEILNERNIGRRVKIIKQFIHVADVCSQLRNYNSMFAIISGLGHSCVARLRRTFDKLKPKYKNQLDKMRGVFDPSKNMLNYRTRLSSTQPPAIPLFPQIKKDLTFTKEGRSIFVRETNELSDDEDTEFSQDTIRRKTGNNLSNVKSVVADPTDVAGTTHHLPVNQSRSITLGTYNGSQKAASSDGDSVLINFTDIRQFTDRVRNVIYFSSIPYSNHLLTNTKDSQRNQAQIKKMHEEWQMRKRIRHYLNQTLTNSIVESSQQQALNRVSSSVSSSDKLDQIDGPQYNKSNVKLVISYDERTLYQKSLDVEPDLNSRTQATNEPRRTGITPSAAVAVQAAQSIQLHLPPPQVAPILNIPPLQPIPANSSPTLSKSSSLSSCSSFNHHLPNYHAARAAGSNLVSGVGKFGTESTESLRKLKALSETADDWRSSSCNTNTSNSNHLGSGNHSNNGLSRVSSDGRGGLARNLIPSRIFPPKNGK